MCSSILSTQERGDPSYLSLLNLVWPIILANAAVPLLGLVDTAVIGHYGSVSELAALAVAALLFNFVYWALGFLRMGTTGFVAQADAHGANIARLLIQSCVLALLLAALLLLFQLPLLWLGIHMLAPPADVASLVGDYFLVRIWAAPAVLFNYIALGYFIGSGQSRILLYLQLLLNITNAVLDIVLAGLFDMGLRGIAIGTVIAEYSACAVALVLVSRQLGFAVLVAAFDLSSLRANGRNLLLQNRDLFIRTLFLLLGFALFTNVGGSLGQATLAANHLGLQLLAFCAFFLDGFAHVLEAIVGRAFAKKNWQLLRVALIRTSVLAAITALILSFTIMVFGADIAAMLTNKRSVLMGIEPLMPLVALYVVIALAAYQLDGLFIGACYAQAMRNCSIFSFVAYALAWYLVFDSMGNTGLWVAFLFFAGIRGISLACYIPRLKRQLVGGLNV